MDDDALAGLVADHQVTVFGFACRQTPELMPLPISLAHALVKELAEVRRSALSEIAPDGQAQVAVEYRGRRPVRIQSVTVVAATWEDTNLNVRTLEEGIRSEVVIPVFARAWLGPDPRTAVSINPQGLYRIGGPQRHAGLTGRKTAMDTYGEFARHSGSALSGKDPGRIERVAAYGARFAAKNVVAAELAEECEVALSYALGQAEPIGMSVSTFGSGRVSEDEIAQRLRRFVDFRPGPMIRTFGLRALPREANGPFYERLAAYGQMGRNDMALPWERTDEAARLAE
jgi:S-adenosylmethionine synthetase